MNNGWIKTHRSKLSWEWFTDYKTSHLFEYILLCASHNQYKWRGVVIKKGHLPFGLNKASIDTGLSVQSIRTSLEKLKSTNEITIKTSNKGSLIRIVKWCDYQIVTSETTNKVTNHQQAINKQSTTTKKVNNVKNVKKYSDALVGCFDDSEIITWLQDGNNKKSQDALLLKYKKDFIINEINKAYCWMLENKKRKAGSFLTGWCDRSNDKDKYNDETNPVLVELRAAEKRLMDA